MMNVLRIGRRWQGLLASGIAVLGLLGCRAKAFDPVASLASARVERRAVETRLTGFRWAPMQAVSRGGDAQRIDPALLAAAGEVRRLGPGEQSLAARHAAALADLLTNHPIEAADALARLATSAHEATIWNDLAAARYAIAVSLNRPETLVGALAAADAALRLNGELREARFNRALIIERMGIRESAVAAWERYLEFDGGSSWAVEARAHLKSLSVVEPAFRDIVRRDYDRLADHPDEARSLVRRFPQEARTWAETEFLGRWAEAELRHDAAAARHLSIAREIGAEIARASSDRMVERAVAAIEGAPGDMRVALAKGHIDFRAGQREFREGHIGKAEPILRRGATELAAGGSPIAFISRYYAAYMAHEQGKMNEATRELESLLAAVPEDFPTCRAKIEWQLAICRGAEGRWGDEIDLALAALAVFERAGEKQYAAMMRELIAQSYEMIGDRVTAWSYRAAALAQIGRTSTTFLQAGILGFLSQEASFRRDWSEAASFTDLEIEIGKTARYEPDLADAHLRRAIIRQHLGGGRPADDVAEAKAIIARIADPGMRSRLEARWMATEAAVASTPSEAIGLLSKAIEFHHGSGGQRMFLPTLFLHRARAHRGLGEAAAARSDVDAAIAELDRHRSSLQSAEQRSGIFESADAIFEEGIDLALAQNDAYAAFGYAEHARARALLESMGSAAPPGQPPTIPAGKVLVEYAVLPSRLVIFVVDGGVIHVVADQIPRDELSADAAAFIDALSHGGADIRPRGRALYASLIAPVRQWIGGKETLVVVPDSAISMVPFAALIGPDERFLVETQAIVTAPSAAVFAYATAERAREQRQQHLLVVVNSVPDLDGLQPLPDAEEEARRVAALYRDARVLRGRDATRQGLLREAPTASVIHFTGHALSSEYRAAETSIVLAGSDGRMNIAEISRMRLSGCAAVVLAACGTARGKMQRYEGASSVARAFLSTGVPSVVATLWPIDDREAVHFFPRLHGHLVRGRSLAEALRAVQTESIHKGDPPALWAAVQVIGS
jgi:CHAT domain-containing protein